jgi:acyl-CoA hydrolase/GNAT superfamily N-acetyltransferase
VYPETNPAKLVALKEKYPSKFLRPDKIFRRIRRGDHIFIGTGCGEPQHLVRLLVQYVEANPTAFFDAELFQLWTMGAAPYADQKFQRNFRLNSFFIASKTRQAVNLGLADYTPIALSQMPELFHRKIIPVDVALIQTSLPDEHGYMSLSVSVDIVKAAVENARLVIVQVNGYAPRIHGDGFIHLDDVDFMVPFDEPLLEYQYQPDTEVVQQISQYVARLIRNGDTLQVGYGPIPNAILAGLAEKKHLGVHTELLSSGLIELMKQGVIDNSQKSANRGRSVATFCMANAAAYAYIHDNPMIEFRTADYTNNPLVIARHDNLVAINTALEIDLTGQATAESMSQTFYSGIGGQADFMRGAVLARHGKTILALESTADNGQVSRIMPYLQQGAGVTLNRADVHYVVTEYGIAYLHGKSIRERAMELITIAHPNFRSMLIESAKKIHLIYQDQAFIPGERGEYPAGLETYRTTKTGLEFLLRPIKISDEPLLKDFFYALSDESMYRRFMSVRKDMPHERLQQFVVVDYTQDMVIVAIEEEEEKETIVGMGQYSINDPTAHMANLSFAVRDDFQNRGIGTELLRYMTFLAKKRGLLGFTAEVLLENTRMLHVIDKMGFDADKHLDQGMYELKISFKESQQREAKKR